MSNYKPPLEPARLCHRLHHLRLTKGKHSPVPGSPAHRGVLGLSFIRLKIRGLVNYFFALGSRAEVYIYKVEVKGLGFRDPKLKTPYTAMG